MTARLVVAAPNSSSGKTTVSIGIMAALRARGLQVAPFKVGPDYIDPGYHGLATGRPGRNLDAWLCGQARIAPLFAHGSRNSDISIIEGVMGLYDGRLGLTEGRRGFGSTAHVAELLDAPVVLVAEPKGVSRTLAASCHGLASLPGAPRVAGVILNKVGSPRALAELRDAFAEIGMPVLGAIPRSTEVVVPSRHLGLVPAAERDQAEEVVAAAAELVAEHVDLDELLRLARSAGELPIAESIGLAESSGGSQHRPAQLSWPPVMTRVAGQPRIAVAAGRAFTFRYAETTELLESAGCQIVEFDPLTAPQLPPDIAGLYLGGGFPELFAEELAANRPLLGDVRAAVTAGLPTVAECAGLLYLCRSLDGVDMAAALPLDAQMSARLTLGYRELTAETASVVTRPGERYRSHEFHRTITLPVTSAEECEGEIERNPTGSRNVRASYENSTDIASAEAEALGEAWSIAPDEHLDGLASSTLLASYQHLHWAGYPQLAQRFAQAAADFAAAGTHWQTPDGLAQTPSPDLRHHGDAQVRPGLVDLAVNVRPAPEWLLRQISASPARWQHYPDARPAQQALAFRYGLPDGQLLVCAGAAEAFTLIANTFPDRRVAIVHPQFTAPEVAWRTAGHNVRRVVLRADDGFRLDPRRISDDVDLVVIGNPTNPTGVLHPASELRRLVRPGRILVVDEAFMDFVPGEPESLLRPDASGAHDLGGIIVTRSLTKLWGIAGLRAGFMAGDPALIEELAWRQEPWSTSTPALDAICAATTADAAAAQLDIAAQVVIERDYLLVRLAETGLRVVGRPQTPFVLADSSAYGPDSLHVPLADLGFAVRRCDSFPGLGPSWLRLAVRDPATTDALIAALLVLGDRSVRTAN